MIYSGVVVLLGWQRERWYFLQWWRLEVWGRRGSEVNRKVRVWEGCCLWYGGLLLRRSGLWWWCKWVNNDVDWASSREQHLYGTTLLQEIAFSGITYHSAGPYRLSIPKENNQDPCWTSPPLSSSQTTNTSPHTHSASPLLYLHFFNPLLSWQCTQLS